MLRKAVDLLRHLEADKEANIYIKNECFISKRPGNPDIVIDNRKGYIGGSLSPNISEEKLEKIYQLMEQHQIIAQLRVALKTGAPFSNYSDLYNVFNEQKTVLAHKPGEVLLVDVWATWCGACQQPMARNQKMLEQNQKLWKGQVRIVGVSVDQQKQIIKQAVTKSNWHSIHHLTLLGWNSDHQLLTDFKIQGLPFICLVDTQGIINYLGHPMQINLENRINQLLQKGKQPKSSSEESKQTLSEDEANKFLAMLTKQKLTHDLKGFQLFCMHYTYQSAFKNQKFDYSLKATAYVMQDDPNTIEKALNYLGKQKHIDISIATVKYIDIPLEESPKCWKCEGQLVYPYYWLKWQQGAKFGCRACVEANSNKQGHHYQYEKNSLLLVNKWTKVSLKNMGNNVQPVNPKSVTLGHSYYCTCCEECSSEKVGEARYICMGCNSDPNFEYQFCDVCLNCLQKIVGRDEAILNELKLKGHSLSHPWLRILYNVNSYHDY